MSLDCQRFESQVVELANANRAAGGRPYACLVVDNALGEVLTQAADRVAQTGDPLAHAEIIAIRDATAKRNTGERQLEDASESGKGLTLFVVSHECSMCSAAIELFGAEVIRVKQGKSEATESSIVDAERQSRSSGLENGHLVNEITEASARREASASHSISSSFMKDIPARRPETRDSDQVTMPSWGDPVLHNRLLTTSNDKHRRTLAHRGTPTSNVVKDIRELNTLVRTHYAKFISDVGMHLRPVIIASDYEPSFQGVGGTFKLFLEDGSVEHITPAPASYQILKSLCHVTLGISSIVLPYLESPHSQGWQTALGSIGRQIDLITSNLGADGITLSSEVVQFIQDMLKVTNDYVKETLKNQFIDADAFHKYSKTVLPYVRQAVSNAGRVQVEADLPALMAWKKKLGDKWKDLYVIIPTVWPVSGDNPRERMLAFLLPNPSIQIVKVQNQSSEADLFTTLGRVVGDRSVAAMVFGAENEFSRDSQLALSTPRDLVSSACAEAMMNYLHTCRPDELDTITSDLSPEAIAAIRAMRSDTKDPSKGSPAIRTFYAEPMSAQDFGHALHRQSHSLPNGHPHIAVGNGSANGCPFGK
jgi:tRNA(Arg) A34 adenosine deaminase TadA